MIVYQTKRNADTVEGRGPMVSDQCFESRSQAEYYINGESGVQGHKGSSGGWKIIEVEVIPDFSVEDYKLTEHDINSIKLFHQERGDITRFVGWEEIKNRDEFLEIRDAMLDLENAKSRLDELVEDLGEES